jgi:hypothetical protein
MIKLNYNPTYIFTTADVFDNTEPPIIFESPSRLSPEWAAMTRNWIRDGAKDIGQALEIVGLAIVAVSQNGERFPLEGREGATALRKAIDLSSPGYGDTFIKHLALGHYNYHFNRLEDKLGNSRQPSPVSGGGANGVKSKSAA